MAVMHPTLTPVVQALAVTDDAIAEYRQQLTKAGDFDYRNCAAIGVLEAILKRLSTEVHSESGRKHLADAIAVLVARDQLAEEEVSRFTYDREDPIDPNVVDPQGVEGFAVGRWAK